MHLDQKHKNTAICHFQYKTNISADVLLRQVLIHGTCIQFSIKYSTLDLRRTIILCYEVFECIDNIKTTAAHLFKNNKWLSKNCFSINYSKKFEEACL